MPYKKTGTNYTNLLISSLIVVIVVSIIAVAYAVLTIRKNEQITSSLNFDLEELKQKTGNADYQYSTDTGYLTSITGGLNQLPLTGTDATDAELIGQRVLQEYGSYFGVNEKSGDLILIENSNDELANTHLKYQQKHQGIDVVGGQLIIHLASDKQLQSINGFIVNDVQVNTTATISQEQAVTTAQAIFAANYPDKTNSQVEVQGLLIVNSDLQYMAAANSLLSWKILIQSEDQYAENLYIDAHTNQLIYRLPLSISLFRKVWDCQNGTLCKTGGGFGRQEGQPAIDKNDVDKAYDFTGEIHNFYQTNFGINGANRLGGLGDGSSNFPLTHTDSFTYLASALDCPNAWYDGKKLTFCTGLVIRDVTAHEYQHAVTDYSVPGISDNYKFETGAINEGFSDIFAELYVLDQLGTTDWKMGSEINLPELQGPLRDLTNPETLNNPGRFYSEKFFCTTPPPIPQNDFGGVHINSTVIGHAGYLMVNGGNYNGCTISAVSKTKVKQVLFKALDSYFTSSVNFNGAYSNINAACTSLIGSNGITANDCNEIKEAMQSVELDQPGKCSTTPRVTPACALTVSPTNTPVKTATPTPTKTPVPTNSVPRTPTCNVNIASSTVGVNQSFNISGSGTSSHNGEQILFRIVKDNGQKISPVPAGATEEIIGGYYYYLIGSCTDNGSGCSKSISISLASIGRYYTFCSEYTAPNVCSGNVFCSYETESPPITTPQLSCTGSVSCSSSDNDSILVMTTSITPTKTPVPSLTKTPIPSPTNQPPQGSPPIKFTPTPAPGSITCGPIDEYDAAGNKPGEGKITFQDFLAFSKSYLKQCNDNASAYLPCGGKNRKSNIDDTTIDFQDLIYFSTKYLDNSCAMTTISELPQTGAEDNTYLQILVWEILASGLIIATTLGYFKQKKSKKTHKPKIKTTNFDKIK